jgi:hypothetical protein
MKPIHQDSASVWIAATPVKVYALISDVTNMGLFSPECYRCELLAGAKGTGIGARFRGYNRWLGMKWSRTSVILTADPGKEFTFQTEASGVYQDSNIWSYRFEGRDGGTLVTESYSTVRLAPWIRLFEAVGSRGKAVRQGMELTLQRLKATAEEDRSLLQGDDAVESSRIEE